MNDIGDIITHMYRECELYKTCAVAGKRCAQCIKHPANKLYSNYFIEIKRDDKNE